MLNKYKAKIKEFFLRFRKYLPIIIILLALPVTIVAGRQIQDLRNFAANETQVLGFVQVNLGSLSTKIGDSDTQMSALAYDPAGRPIWADVTYEWSMSSINSVGTLGATSGNISSFKPLQLGYGDLHIIARMGPASVEKSIPVIVADANGVTPTPPSISPTPTCLLPEGCSTITPKPTCRPRPSCLDQTPRCAIPETSDMCPPPSPKPTETIKTLTFYPQADSYIRNNYPSTNYGDRNVLWIDGSPIAVSYLKFNITSLRNKTVTKATLKLKVPDITDANSNGKFNLKVTGNSWSERNLNYSNRTVLNKMVGSFKKPKKGQTISVDLTGWLGGFPPGDIISFGIDTESADGAILRSKEASSKDNRPVLIIDYR